jgi:hypothetical protein
MSNRKSLVTFALAIVALTLGGAVSTKSDRPTLKGNSSYVSQEATLKGVRSRINVQGEHFQMIAVGRDPKTGDGSHDGGMMSIVESRQSYRLRSVGIIIPKEGVTKWTDETGTCERLNLTSDTYATACTSKFGDKFTYLISKPRGVLSFTGHCFLTKERLCNYVLITEKGIAAL